MQVAAMISADAATELLARGVAVGAFLALAIAVARSASGPARWSGVLFCLAAAAHTLTQWPGPAIMAGPAVTVIWAFSVMGAGFFWAFARDLFEDTRLDLRRFVPALLLLAIGLAGGAHGARPSFWLLHNLVGGVLALHVLFLVATGWRGDLVEQRRRLRAPVLLAGVVYALVIIVVQTGEIFVGSAEALSPVAATVLLALSLISMWAFGRVDPSLFATTEAQEPTEDKPPAPIDGADASLATELDRLMRVEKLYREEALTISSLAMRLRVPEHRLRQLINQKLGHRNFSAFLNQWRLEDTKLALRDPAQKEVPISTIALDAGFASLGPFNRAFKANTGQTPTAFRASASGG
jgi:AraC-like DNA-binding protein